MQHTELLGITSANIASFDLQQRLTPLTTQ